MKKVSITWARQRKEDFDEVSFIGVCKYENSSNYIVVGSSLFFVSHYAADSELIERMRGFFKYPGTEITNIHRQHYS